MPNHQGARTVDQAEQEAELLARKDRNLMLDAWIVYWQANNLLSGKLTGRFFDDMRESFEVGWKAAPRLTPQQQDIAELLERAETLLRSISQACKVRMEADAHPNVLDCQDLMLAIREHRAGDPHRLEVQGTIAELRAKLADAETLMGKWPAVCKQYDDELARLRDELYNAQGNPPTPDPLTAAGERVLQAAKAERAAELDAVVAASVDDGYTPAVQAAYQVLEDGKAERRAAVDHYNALEAVQGAAPVAGEKGTIK